MMGRKRRSTLGSSDLINKSGTPTPNFENKINIKMRPCSPSYSPKHPGISSDVASTPISYKTSESPPLFGNVSPVQTSPSPIPFICTQDGSHGENDVVWDYYSPISRKNKEKHISTPLRKKRPGPECFDYSPISRISTRKMLLKKDNKSDCLKILEKKLAALDKQVQEITSSDTNTESEKSVGDSNIVLKSFQSNYEVDLFDQSVFNTLTDFNNEKDSNNSFPSFNKRIEKLSKCDVEVLESDDSMNEYLLRASQLVEEGISSEKCSLSSNIKESENFISLNKFTNHENNLKNKLLKKIDPVNLNNDSFDSLISGINDSYIDTLSQVPKSKVNCNSNLKLNNNEEYHDFHIKQKSENTLSNIDLNITHNHNVSKTTMITNIFTESKNKFSRHNSMPMSQSAKLNEKPQTNNKSTFVRHKSMPSSGENMKNSDATYPSCTPEEIQKKHQAAKEKLLSKLQEPKKFKIFLSKNKPNNSTNKNNRNLLKENSVNQVNKPSVNTSVCKHDIPCIEMLSKKNSKIQAEIERKRKEALQRLNSKKNMK